MHRRYKKSALKLIQILSDHIYPRKYASLFSRSLQFRKLQKELANPHSDFYFIFVDNQLGGYMKLNREKAQTEPMGPEKLEVERLYILRV